MADISRVKRIVERDKVSQRHITSLDSLRGVFALMIVLLHLPVNWSMLHSPIIRNGAVGVDFFFVLSGFVLGLSYSDRMWSVKAFFTFIIRRIGRLWPLHATVLALFLILEIAKSYAAKYGFGKGIVSFYDSPNFWLVFLQDITLTNGFRNEVSMELNFPAWSIGAEVIAYATFSLLLFLNSKLRYVAIFGIILFCLSVLADLISIGFGKAADWGVLRATALFLIGYIVQITYRASLSKEIKVPQPSLVEISLVFIICLGIWFRLETALSSLFLPIIFSAALFVFGYQSGKISDILNRKIFVEIGKRSYSIYLIHAFVLSVLGSFIRAIDRLFQLNAYFPGQIGDNQISVLDFGSVHLNNIFVAAVLFLIYWISGYTYLYIEIPGQRAFKRLSDRFIS